MPVELVTTAYGPPAHERLQRAVREVKGDDPLTPVTVIVPSNYVGIAARRAMGRAGGVAAVTFLTTYRLAELLGGARLAGEGRRPVSMPVVAGAVRGVLHDAPGHFAGVETHPTTERALTRAHRELSDVPERGLRRLAATSARAADVVRVHRSVRARLAADFSDEQDLLAAATAQVSAGSPVLDQLGPVIVHLPQRLTEAQAALLRAVAESLPVLVIAGLVGHEAADAPVAAAVGRLGVELRGDPSVARAAPSRAISVSDADDEVRHAIRAVIDAARDGVPLGRCAIVHGTHEPYARLVTEALDAADLPWWGSSVRTAGTSLLGRSLLDLLALPDRDFARSDVSAWLGAAPVRRPDGTFVPAAAWERASRLAGVVAGRSQWTERLEQAADDLDDSADRFVRVDGDERRADHARREAGWCRALAGFVEHLAARLDESAEASTWRELSRWCRSLVRDLLGHEGHRTGWPDEERRAAEWVERIIERLGELDGIDPAPSYPAFRRALELELDGDLGRRGSFAHGVLVGPATLALGVELDLVIVLGLAEGTFPARRREDSLLPDRERLAAAPDLALRAQRLDDDHRALLAVLAAAEESLLVFPRGDLRRSAERAPSRWLLDAVEAHDGVRPAGDELAALTGDWFREVPSHVNGLQRTAFPATEQEFDVVGLLELFERHGLRAIHGHESLARRSEVSRGVELVVARRSSAYTRFDGNLAGDGDLRGVRLPSPADEGVLVSASRLETWASCPHEYFVRYVLGIDAIEAPDEQYRISALDRGSLVHEVLDRWIGESIDADAVPAPGEAWPMDARRRLIAIAVEESDRIEARGRAGRRLHWERTRRSILRDVIAFVDHDDALRTVLGGSPVATELGFGLPGAEHPPLIYELDGGRRLRVRGSIDRVDRRTGGGLAVIDYKTGSSWRYRNLSEADPVPAGRFLQLPLYALAATELLGSDAQPVDASYWFVSAKGGFARRGYPVTEAVLDAAARTITAIVDGIEDGHFPLHPSAPSWTPFNPCWFCDPDDLGTRDAHRAWERKRPDPQLRPYLRLVDPDLFSELEAAP